MKIRIGIIGCDDETFVWKTVTMPDYRLLKDLAIGTHENGGGCKPIMVLYCGESRDCNLSPAHDGECSRY